MYLRLCWTCLFFSFYPSLLHPSLDQQEGPHLRLVPFQVFSCKKQFFSPTAACLGLWPKTILVVTELNIILELQILVR